MQAFPENHESFSLREITTYQAGVAQASMNRIIQKECDEHLKQYGITKMHWLIIGTVLDSGARGIRITDLAETLQTGLPYLTTTINLLEKKHILERTIHSKDSRAKYVCISKDFRLKCPEIERTLREKLRESLYSKVDPEEFMVFMKVMFTLGSLENK